MQCKRYLKNTQNTQKNKSKIYFFGGAQGCGKSTLLNNISKKFEIPKVNSGKFFSKGKSIKQSKIEIINTILSFKEVIIDGHYAGFSDYLKNELEQGFTNEELKKISNNAEIYFFLIDLTTFALKERREKDKKLRNLPLSQINKELISERKYFRKYCYLTKQPGYIVYNYHLKQTILDLNTIFSHLQK